MYRLPLQREVVESEVSIEICTYSIACFRCHCLSIDPVSSECSSIRKYKLALSMKPNHTDHYNGEGNIILNLSSVSLHSILELSLVYSSSAENILPRPSHSVNSNLAFPPSSLSLTSPVSCHQYTCFQWCISAPPCCYPVARQQLRRLLGSAILLSRC